MPPQRSQDADDNKTTAFGRAHPNLQKTLIASCQACPFLLIATILMGAGVLKRPKWERIFLWRAALWSFLSRWILVSCAITWSWNDWGRDNERGQEQNFDNNDE